MKWLYRIEASNIYILYDGDDAGIFGAKKLNLAFPESTIIEMPSGTDPNSLTNLKEFLESKGVPK